MAWLRAHVPRIVDGATPRRRRALVEREAERLAGCVHEFSPTKTLLSALGLDSGWTRVGLGAGGGRGAGRRGLPVARPAVSRCR